MSIALRSGQGRGVLLATVLGSGIAFMDGTVINVALPTLERELHASLAGLQWTVDAYLLLLGALVLSGGTLGDRLGRRRVFVAGMSWFGVASALCAAAPSIGFLVVARALQGIGAALLVPGSLALLRASIDKRDQGRAIGAWSGLSGVTTAIGPLVGGWLVTLNWRLVFLLNLPLVALAIWAALRFIPESRGSAARIDLPSSLTAALGLGGIVFALIEWPAVGASGAVLACGAAGLAGLAAFFVLEARLPAPMMPLRVFRSLAFSAANAVTFAVYFGIGGAFFVLALQLQQTLRYTPFAAGAAFTPVTLLLLALSPSAGRLAQRIGPRLPMTAGPLVAGAGLLLGERIVPGATYAGAVLPCTVVLGLGLAATVAPLTSTALSALEPELAGAASGVNNAVARVAGLFAVAVLPLASGMAHGTLAAAFPRAMAIAAATCAAGGAIAFVALRGIGQRLEPGNS